MINNSIYLFLSYFLKMHVRTDFAEFSNDTSTSRGFNFVNLNPLCGNFSNRSISNTLT